MKYNVEDYYLISLTKSLLTVKIISWVKKTISFNLLNYIIIKLKSSVLINSAIMSLTFFIIN